MDEQLSLLDRFYSRIPKNNVVKQYVITTYVYDKHKPNNPCDLTFNRETAEAFAEQEPGQAKIIIPKGLYTFPMILLLPDSLGLIELRQKLGYVASPVNPQIVGHPAVLLALVCSFPGCEINPDDPLKHPQYACSGCLRAIYHGRGCQEAHFADHKDVCYNFHTDHCEGEKGCLYPCAHEDSPMQEVLNLLEEAETDNIQVDEDAYNELTAKAAQAQVDREVPIPFPIDPVTKALSDPTFYLRKYMRLDALPDELEDPKMQMAVLENFIMIILSKKEKQKGELRKRCQSCKLGESSRRLTAQNKDDGRYTYYYCTLCHLETSTIRKGGDQSSDDILKSRCNLAAFFRIAPTCVYCNRELHCQTVSGKGRASCDAMQPSALSTFLGTKDSHHRGGLVPCCYDCNYLKNMMPFRFFVLLSNIMGPKWREWAFANAPPPAGVLDNVASSNEDGQMRWLKAEVLGALMTRHINEERQEAIAAAAAAVVAAPQPLTSKDKGNVIKLGQHGIQLPIDSSTSSISAALNSMDNRNVSFTNLFNAIRGRRYKIGLMTERNNRFNLIDFLQRKGFAFGNTNFTYAEKIKVIKAKLKGTFKSRGGEIKAIIEGIAMYSVDLSIHLNTTKMLERPDKSCNCWGEQKPANANLCTLCINSVNVDPLMLKLGAVTNKGGKICWACQIHIEDFVNLGFPFHTEPKKKATYFGVDAKSQFYDHSLRNVDFCCTLCNFLKRTILSVKAMLHMDSELDRNLAGFWKGIHNVTYHDDDDDNDAVPNEVDRSKLVTGALGIAFPPIMFEEGYTPDTRNISKKDWDMAVVKSNEIKEMFKEEGEVWNNVDEAYNIAMEMSVKADKNNPHILEDE